MDAAAAGAAVDAAAAPGFDGRWSVERDGGGHGVGWGLMRLREKMFWGLVESHLMCGLIGDVVSRGDFANLQFRKINSWTKLSSHVDDIIFTLITQFESV